MSGSMTVVSWFRSLAKKGGKGIVNNIDARSLGRIADEIEAKDAEIARLRREKAEMVEMLEKLIRAGNGIGDEVTQDPDWRGAIEGVSAALRFSTETHGGGSDDSPVSDGSNRDSKPSSVTEKRESS